MYQQIKMPVPKEVMRAVEEPRAFLTPSQVAPILGVDPEVFRLMAREGRYNGEFLVHFSGNRIRVPKIPFLRALGYEVGPIMEGTA